VETRSEIEIIKIAAFTRCNSGGFIATLKRWHRFFRTTAMPRESFSTAGAGARARFNERVFAHIPIVKRYSPGFMAKQHGGFQNGRVHPCHRLCAVDVFLPPLPPLSPRLPSRR